LYNDRLRMPFSVSVRFLTLNYNKYIH